MVENDAAERLLEHLASNANGKGYTLAKEALADERRATVERIRERYAMHGDKYFLAWLDAEAGR